VTKLLLHELEKFQWDIMVISETHWTGMDNRRFEGQRLVISGRNDSGVALILGQRAEKSLLGFSPVNDSIISARFKTMTGSMTVFHVYAPTMLASDQEIEEFYGRLQEVINNMPRTDL
jgi:hypothetical protein